MIAEDQLAEAPLGAPAAASYFELAKRLDRLVQRVLDGVCVPFLGAGISMEAERTVEHSPTLNSRQIAIHLARKLAERLQSLAKAPAGHPQWGLRTLGLDCARLNADGSFKRDAQDQELVPMLGEVAELCWSVLTPVETCEILRLEEWNKPLPTAAHHYLAVLVREGLITEVLETNYDEFVERAVQESFGSELPAEERDEVAPVISDLDSYRNHIASPRDDRQQRALVKVVKLNGCAAAYRRVKEAPQASSEALERAARSIIMTEEQLQSWGDKNWARDLLNDRVRSRTLLFIGFGAADPIVRHHSVQVIQEFQGSAPAAGPSPGSWYEYKNAPFIAAYESNLSFYQYQILRDFRDAHTARRPGVQGAGLSRHEQLDHVASVYANTFLGGDGPSLARPARRTKPGELPADVFLEALATRCVCRLARERWFGPKSPLHSYLQGVLSHPRTLLAELCHGLFSGELDTPPPFVDWMRLRNPTQRHQRASPWATVCFALRGQTPGRAGYRPFLESPIKQTMLIVLMALALRDAQGRLRLPSAEELSARAGSVSSPLSEDSTRVQVPAYRLLDADGARGQRAVFATSLIDRLLMAEQGILRVERMEDIIPDHSIIIGLGRGNLGVLRRQLWVEVSPAAAAPQARPEYRAVREVYIVGDLTAIRGQDSQSVDLHRAHANLLELARMPESFVKASGGWRHSCRESA